MKSFFTFGLLFMCFLHINFAQSFTELDVVSPDRNLVAYRTGFGTSTSIDGNYGVIGICTNQVYTGEVQKGRAWVVKYNGVKWERIAELTATDTESHDEFGTSVCIMGNTIVVGAPKAKRKLGKGAVYVYEKTGAEWTNMSQTAKLTANYVSLGLSVSVFDDVVVSGTSDGVFVFEKPSTGWVNMKQTATLNRTTNAARIAARGVDICENTIAVTASDGVLVYTKTATGWKNATQVAQLNPAQNAHLALNKRAYGSSVAIDSDNTTIVMGCTSRAQNGRSTAYVFEKPASGWANMNETCKLTTEEEVIRHHNFGTSIDISNDVIVIGTKEDTRSIPINDGFGYIYMKNHLRVGKMQMKHQNLCVRI